MYQQNDDPNKNLLNRYFDGSRADPINVLPDWNRSFEVTVDKPRGGVLLVHGLSVSPYSMRALAPNVTLNAERLAMIRRIVDQSDKFTCTVTGIILSI